MHSIAISPGVEDSVHLRTSSLSLPHNPVAFPLASRRHFVSPSLAELPKGLGRLEGSCIQLITPPELITSRPGSRPTYTPSPSRLPPWLRVFLRRREFPASLSRLLLRPTPRPAVATCCPENSSSVPFHRQPTFNDTRFSDDVWREREWWWQSESTRRESLEVFS